MFFQGAGGDFKIKDSWKESPKLGPGKDTPKSGRNGSKKRL
jgi:hypothetical protein